MSEQEKHRRILSFLQELKNSHKEMSNIFNYGSCMNLFCILRVLYPEAKAYYNQDHIITEIGGIYYDIEGVANPRGYTLFTEWYNKERTSRAFKQMYNANYKIK